MGTPGGGWCGERRQGNVRKAEDDEKGNYRDENAS